MNILFYSENEVLPQNGGTERATYMLANFFETQSISINYVIRNFPNYSEDTTGAFYFPNNIDLNSIENVFFLEELIFKKSIDLIIITIPTPQLYFLLNNLKENPKVITIIHAPVLEYLPFFSRMFKFEFSNPIKTFESFLRGVRLPFLYISLRKKIKSKFELINNYSDKIVVLSENYKNDLLNLNQSIISGKVVSIENTNPFFIRDFDLKKMDQVLFVGRLTHIKRVDHILKAWDSISTQRENWSLKIIGHGDEKEMLEKFALKNKISNVSFEGKKDPKHEYQISSIICLTSIYEGMPMVLLEALQFGVVPVVYNTFGASTDIIINGYNGFLVKPFDYRTFGETISFLINNPNELKKMSKNALESSKKFDMKCVGSKWIDLLKRL